MTKANSLAAKEIITFVGGENNIKEVFHCITRLRFYLNDKNIVNVEKLKRIPGVIGVQFSGDQLQIIIGNDVISYYDEIIKSCGNKKRSIKDTNQKKEKNWKQKITWKNLFSTLSAIFLPIVPALAGTGMLKGIVTLIQMYGHVPANNGPLQVLIMASDCVFYFLPFLVAWSSAKRFKTDIPVSLALAGILLYPTMTHGLEIGKKGIDFFNLNIPFVRYSASSIPIILVVLVLSWLYPKVNQAIPKVLQFVFTPMIVVAIMTPLELIAIAPLANYISIGLATIVNWLFKFSPILAGLVVGSTRSLVVLSGMHLSLGAICIQNLAKYGYDVLLPINTMGTLAMCGAGLGTWFYVRNSKYEKLKQVSMSAFISAVIGITEPTIYGLLIKFRNVLYATMIGGGVAGAFVAFFKGTANAYVNSCLLSLPVFVGPSFIYTCIGMAIAFIISFIMVQILGINLKTEQETDIHKNIENNDTRLIQTIKSPFSGQVSELKTLKDGVFSKNLLGKGILITPDSNNVYAPVTGTIEVIADTKHAIGLKTLDGIEILIHMGIDTVNLKGKYFKILVKKGQQVKQGQKIAEVNFKEIKQKGYSIASPVVITNTNNYKNVLPILTKNSVVAEDDILSIEKEII
ncbi:MAG: glucose PTS transporter subunit IIA [Lactobacillus sp.]|nr:glucose PTS transporter subunit IIA [Lactobacillus sp.]